MANDFEEEVLLSYWRFESLFTRSKYLYLVAQEEDTMSELDELINAIKLNRRDFDIEWCENFYTEVSKLYRIECQGSRSSLSEIGGFLDELQAEQDEILEKTNYVDQKIRGLVDLVYEIIMELQNHPSMGV
jgi:hypothetical protein